MCSWCGKPGKLERHHPDYAKPLEIVWVCLACHSLLRGGGTLTHCPGGHERTPENTIWRRDGRRACRVCHNERRRIMVAVEEPNKIRRKRVAVIEDEADEPEESPYLTFMQVCRKYEISRQSLHTLCTNRRIPYYTKYNGRRRFRKDEMEEYLALQRHEPLNPLTGRSKAK
jgi:hypothetical protein